jgi:endoglucanase
MMRIARRQAWSLMAGMSCVLMGSGPSRATSTVSETRYQRLARGINLPGWFAWGPKDAAQILDLFPAGQLGQLTRMGLTHVRVPVDLWLFLDPVDPGRPNPEPMAALHAAIERILASELAVIVDLHPTNETHPARAWGKRLERDDAFVDDYVTFWGGLARELARHDPERLFLEPMNEPAFHEVRERWTEQIQPRVAARVRAEAPSHTLIATAPLYSWPAELAKLTPLADSNVVYAFHYYDPYIFTHQGFRYGPFAELTGLPYPADAERIASLLGGFPERHHAKVTKYGDAGWNAQRVARDVSLAADWAARHGVRVICNEFGIVRDTVPEADRARWLADLRQALQAHGIGWSMWEYGGWFGLFSSKAPSPADNVATISALGLRVEN